MEVINATLRDQKGKLSFVKLRYEKEDDEFLFAEEIHNGDWTIDSTVRSVAYKSGIDTRNYLAFIITDCKGVSRLFEFYYNRDSFDTQGIGYDYALSESGIRRFLEFYPIFSCRDWEDYDCHRIIGKVKEILENGYDNVSTVEDIRNALGK